MLRGFMKISDTRDRATIFALTKLGFLYFCIHSLMLIYDSYYPDVFLFGDRSEQRWQKVEGILHHQGDFWATLVKNADPGDYLYQAFIYALSGRFGLVLFQVVLGFGTVVCTVYLARYLGLSDRTARLAGLVMILMPGSLWQPHTLVTEAIYNPVVACAALLLVRFMLDPQRSSATRYLYAGLLMVGLASSIRHQFSAFPFVLAAYFICRPALRKMRFLLPILPLSFLFAGAWTAIVFGHTGSLKAPPSDHDFGTNLYNRIARVAEIDQFRLGTLETAEGRISIAQFGSYVAAHPTAYLRTLATDGANLLLNPGSIIVLTRYLPFGPKAEDSNLWTNLRDRANFREVLESVFEFGVAFVASILVMEVIWLACLLFAALGAIQFFSAPQDRDSRLFLLILLVYSLSVLFASGSIRWQHRTPVDFILGLLVAAGIAAVSARWSGRRSARPRET